MTFLITFCSKPKIWRTFKNTFIYRLSQKNRSSYFMRYERLIKTLLLREIPKRYVNCSNEYTYLEVEYLAFPLFYQVFFTTFLAVSFRTSTDLPLCFVSWNLLLISRWPFYNPKFGFYSFLEISLTDKSVDRSTLLITGTWAFLSIPSTNR